MSEVKTKLVNRNPIYIDQYYYGDDGTVAAGTGPELDVTLENSGIAISPLSHGAKRKHQA